ncbi:MAG: 30S ribosomal protein S19 [Candidatus Iainarchaeum sp.]|jgi:small subunit ribosomal protein S19|nr:MAG: 30S ribosomal protein S19 [archaeon ADurb.Bin336]
MVEIRKVTFRGKTLEELQAMSIQEFAELCTSRARRSLLKNGVDKKFLKKVEATKQAGKPKYVKTHRRDLIVVPQMVGGKISVYKGKDWEQIEVTTKMLGKYLGEFALTRKRLQHGKAGIGATKSSTAVTAR